MYTAIFDIGKTNKKCLVFDQDHQVVMEQGEQLPTTKDEDGFECEDLQMLTEWMQTTFQKVRQEFPITHLNFATYGASLVHLDEAGKPVTPLYNYLKPFPEKLAQQFYQTYGPEDQFSLETASPALGMLNSGLQLYWLKYHHPDQFKKIRHSLHLPQYCSYLFSGQMACEPTSVGCHTALWSYPHQCYHPWLEKEGMSMITKPLGSSSQTLKVDLNGQTLQVGVGIHDSSAALYPYLRQNSQPFLLLSTGTWNICLNPFNQDLLTPEELEQDCLNYLQPNGQMVKASRIFLGYELEQQIESLAVHYQTNKEHYQSLEWEGLKNLHATNSPVYRFTSISNLPQAPASTNLDLIASYELAYYQLMHELVQLQLAKIQLAIGKTEFTTLYIEGGFAKNTTFLGLLSQQFSGIEVKVGSINNGTALGAAMVMA